MTRPSVTERLMNYRLLRVLASTADGAVYAASSEDGDVAIRVGAPEASMRLLSRMAACGDDAYPVLDLGSTADGAIAIVMPVCRQTLQDAYQTGDRRAVIEGMAALCRALLSLHGAGLAHGRLRARHMHRHDGGWALTGWRDETAGAASAVPAPRAATAADDVAALDQIYERLREGLASPDPVRSPGGEHRGRTGAPHDEWLIPEATPVALPPDERLARDAAHWDRLSLAHAVGRQPGGVPPRGGRGHRSRVRADIGAQRRPEPVLTPPAEPLAMSVRSSERAQHPDGTFRRVPRADEHPWPGVPMTSDDAPRAWAGTARRRRSGGAGERRVGRARLGAARRRAGSDGTGVDSAERDDAGTTRSRTGVLSGPRVLFAAAATAGGLAVVVSVATGVL
ncbi:hypothetical protein [Mycetocola reblochoni]|nr:hypothetical protein [Mycetocola reblochoni]